MRGCAELRNVAMAFREKEPQNDVKLSRQYSRVYILCVMSRWVYRGWEGVDAYVQQVS